MFVLSYLYLKQFNFMLYLVGTDLCHHDREVDIVACLEIILTKGNIKGVLERCVWPQTVRIESLVHNMIA